MDNQLSALRSRLSNSWDAMKVRYPIVINADLVKADPVKSDFLNHIDGLKSTDELKDYFTLNNSEAHLIFTDLLNAGALRFLEEAERLDYLKNQRTELKRNLEFQKAERNKLRGEKLYLSKRISEKENTIASINEKTPPLKENILELTSRLSTLKISEEELTEYNAELFSLVRDIKLKEELVKKVLEKLDYEMPKATKQKMRVVNKIVNANKKISTTSEKNMELENKLIDYHEAINEARDYLEDVRGRVEDIREEL